MGLQHKKFWTPEMDDIIEEAAVRNLNRQETADRLGVSVPTMVKRAAVVGIFWEAKNRGKDHPNCLPPQALENHALVMDGVQYADVERIATTYQRFQQVTPEEVGYPYREPSYLLG